MELFIKFFVSIAVAASSTTILIVILSMSKRLFAVGACFCSLFIVVASRTLAITKPIRKAFFVNNGLVTVKTPFRVFRVGSPSSVFLTLFFL